MEEELKVVTPIVKLEKEKPNRKGHNKDWFGATLGLLVFLVGVGLLVLVFKMSLDLFNTPPKMSLEIKTGRAIDVAKASDTATAVVVRVIVLVLMAITGSLIANRGIHLYSVCARRIRRN